MGLNKRERGGGTGGWAGQLSMCVETVNLLRGLICRFWKGRNAPVHHVHPVGRTTSEERAECSRGWVGVKEFLTALGRIDVRVCCTRCARSRRWCG